MPRAPFWIVPWKKTARSDWLSQFFPFLCLFFYPVRTQKNRFTLPACILRHHHLPLLVQYAVHDHGRATVMHCHPNHATNDQ